MPDPQRKTAQLVVNILDEGPRARIGDIYVSGNKISSREEIVNYLKLRPGDCYDRPALCEVKQRLLDSGRFFDASIKPLGTSDSPRILSIEVKELENAPPLGKPLLPEEEILLKFGKWFGDIDRWQGDMLIETQGSLGTSTIVVSPHRGILATAKLKGLKRSGTQPDYAFAMTKDEIGIFSARGRKVVVALLQSNSKLVANLGLAVCQEEEQDKKVDGAKRRRAARQTAPKELAAFGLGVKSLDAGEAAPPFALSMKVLPAANLNDAHRPNTTYVIRNGLLTMTSGDDYDAVIDASSGRLVQFTVYDAADEPSDKAAGKKASDDNAKKAETMICRISFEAGAFERRLKEVHEMARRYPDDYDAQSADLVLRIHCGRGTRLEASPLPARRRTGGNRTPHLAVAVKPSRHGGTRRSVLSDLGNVRRRLPA